MTSLHINVASLLIDLEKNLRDLNLWDSEAPPPEALLSDKPFAIDTLEFYQWLQFIFLPRMHALVDAQGPLPPKCEIAPMAEEAYRHGPNINLLLDTLEKLDRVLSQGH